MTSYQYNCCHPHRGTILRRFQRLVVDHLELSLNPYYMPLDGSKMLKNTTKHYLGEEKERPVGTQKSKFETIPILKKSLHSLLKKKNTFSQNSTKIIKHVIFKK